MENRKQFFSRFNTIPRKARIKIELAYILAKDAHRPQRRQELDREGKPLRYFEHPRRTALIAIDELGFTDWELICTLLLHDVVEDTRYINEEHIEDVFSLRVADCVMLVSKLPKAGYEKRLLGCGEWRALITKGCDRLDNLRSLDACSPEKRERKLQETTELYYPIFEHMFTIAPEEHFQKTKLLTELIFRKVNELRNQS